MHTCWQDQGCQIEQEWNGTVPVASFQFGPLMDGASFSGEVEGCRFDVVWSPEGPVAPFEGHGVGSSSNLNGESWHADAFAGVGGFGEVSSRVAPADIRMAPAPTDGSCAPYVRQGAPGFVSWHAEAGQAAAGITAD